MKKRNVSHYMNLLEKVQTELNRETQVTGSFPLTLPSSLIADHALEPKRGMKLAFLSDYILITKSCSPESPLSSKYSINDRETVSFTKVSRGVLSPGDEAPGTNMGPANRGEIVLRI